jgi:hypothetical protein
MHYQVPETLDLHDVKWIDDEDNEEGQAIAVKTVSTRRASYRPPNKGHDTEFTFEVSQVPPVWGIFPIFF